MNLDLFKRQARSRAYLMSINLARILRRLPVPSCCAPGTIPHVQIQFANSAEAKTTFTLNYSKSGAQEVITKAANYTITGVVVEAGIQTIGTSAEAITKGDVGTLGWAYMENIDPTNYIDVAVDSSVATPFSGLVVGSYLWIPTKNVTYYAKANTAPCNLRKCLIEV